MPILIRDAETRSELDLEEVGAWRYSTHPSTDVLLYSYCVDDGPIQTWRRGDPPPQEFIQAATEPEWLVAAFNESFERGLELNVLIPHYCFPRIPDARRRCLQMSALAQALPAKLERVAAALGLPVQKDKAGRKAMLEMARPRAPLPGEDPSGIYWHEDEERWARNTAYNVRDVEVEREVYRHLGFVSLSELELAALDTIINDRGVGIDRVLLDAALKIAEAAVPAQIAEFDALTEGAFEKPRTPKLRAWLEERGIKVPNLQAETLQKVLARPGLSPELRRLLEVRIDLAQSATAGKLVAMRNWCGADGRVRWAFRHHGASTGRATSLGIQLQNMKKPGDTDLTAAIAAISTGDYETVRKQFGDPMRALGVCARTMIVAAPGHRLLIGDLSGIESRLSAHAAGEIWKVKAWAQFDRTSNPEDEPYYIVGTKHFRLAPETAREPGKTGDLAFSYTGGWKAWARFAPAEAEEALTQAEAEARKNAWRQAHPQIVRFWGTLNRAAINAMRRPGHEVRARGITFVYRKEQRNSLILRLLSGRELTYPFARLRNNRRGDLVVTFMDNQQGKWVECRHGEGAFGGTWMENCIQAAARDVFYSAMQRLKAAGYRIVLHVHDEVVAEMPEGTGSMEEFKRLLIEPPAWALDLPLNAKVRESQRFCKTSPAQAVAQEIGAQETVQEIAQEIVEEPENPLICAQCGEALDGTEQDYDGIKLHARCTDAYLARRLVEEGFAATPAPEIEAPPWDDPPTASASAPSSASSSSASSSASSSTSSSAGSGNSNRQPKGPPGPRIGAWIYRTEHGVPYLKVIKTKNKHFYQEHWTGNGWASGKPDGPPIPYRLPELMAAPANVEVFICEGEKDAANVATLGLIATTAPEGAGKWVPALNKWFGGRRTVYILADNDDRGRRHAQQVADALQPIVLDRVVIVHFSELPEHGDVSDWIHAGGTKEQLLERARAANTTPPPPRYTLVCAADIVPRPMDWLWEGHILRGSQELLTGVPGGGKSQIHCAFVASTTTGGIWPDGTNGAPRGNVIMLTAEDCLEQTLVPRLIAAGADRERVFVLRKIRKDNKERMFLLHEDLEELERMIKAVGDVRLITIDPITAFMGGKIDSHRATDVRGQLGPLADLAERMDVALSAITHPAKHSTQRAIDHFIGSQAFIAAARIGHMAIEEVDENEQGQRMPTGRSLFANAKNNVSRKMPTLAYRVVEKQLDGDIKAAHVVWEEIVDITADQAIMAASPLKGRDQSGPVMLLMNMLANGPTPAKIVEERGKACGFSMDQLYRAKRKIGAVRFKEKGAFAGQWFWALAEHAPEDTTPED